MAQAKQTKEDMQFDVELIRQDFPCLHQFINEKPLVYLDSAATTQKPQAVIDALSRFYQQDYANVHRSIHALGERSTRLYEDAREIVQHFINAKYFKECIFVRGTTEAINLVATSFIAPRIKQNEVILISEMEHHSNIVPWQVVCQNTGAQLKVIPFNDHGELDLDAYEKILTTEDVKFLAVTHISNALGTINPIKKMIKMAHEHDVVVLVDGAQAAPHTKIDVQDLDCDFYTFSGHKMYGPTGIGVLYGKTEKLEGMNPYQTGGEMIAQVTFDATSYAPIPHKFEAGTPNIVGVIGLAAAIVYLNDVGMKNIAKHEQELLAYATKTIGSLSGIGLLGTAKEKISILSFMLQDVHAHDIGTVLNSLGVAVRSGHLCTMPIMEHFQVEATTRASFGLYNTKAEIDILAEAIEEVAKVFGK